MKTTEYSKWNLVVAFGNTYKFFYGIVAINADAAFADVTEAYGQAELIQIGRS